MFICCVCLTFEESLFPIVSLYTSSFVNCTGIHPSKNDFLCPKCIERMKEAESFREQAIMNYKHLQEKVLEESVLVKEEPVEMDELIEGSSDLEMKKTEEMVEYVTIDNEVIKSYNIAKHHESNLDIIQLQTLEEENIMEEEYLSEAFDDESVQEEVIQLETPHPISKTDSLIKEEADSITKVPSIKSIKAKEAWTADTKKFLIKNCPYCFYYTKNRTEMTSHVQDHIVKNGGVECDHCGRMFRTKQLIKEHLVRVYKGGYNRAPPAKRPKKQTPRIYVCDWCDAQCQSKEILEEHIILGHTDNPLSYFCRICLKSFEKKATLKLHIYNKHTDRANLMYECRFCRKNFKSKRSLEYHESIHTGKIKYTCPICSKGIKTKLGLDDHMLMHSGELNFPCNVCQKPFRSKALLRSHMVLHSDNFKHTCETCGLKFRRSTNLAEHLAVHSNVKRFMCSLCKTLFKTKQSLRRHTKQHMKKLGLVETAGDMQELVIKSGKNGLDSKEAKIEEVT